MEATISAIGTANPAYKRNQMDVAELITNALKLRPAEKRLLKTVYKSTGIDERYSVLTDYCSEPGNFEFFPNDSELPFPSTADRMKIYKDNALKLSLSAITDCLKQISDFDKNTITHLITVSCTGMYAPGVDIEIIEQLNLKTTLQRTAIQFMGCYAAFNGLKIANDICKANPTAKVLLVSVELCTLHFQKSMDLDSVIANAIFADGAACALIEANPQHDKYFSLSGFHCDILPQSNHEMAWSIGNNGFDIVLSSYVPDVINRGIRVFIERLLDQYRMQITDINFFAIHPGGIKILQACEDALKIKQHDLKYAYHVLRHYGNMSSATILFVLKAIWEDINNRDHDKQILGCAFGPGLTVESMLLKIHHV